MKIIKSQSLEISEMTSAWAYHDKEASTVRFSFMDNEGNRVSISINSALADKLSEDFSKEMAKKKWKSQKKK